MPHMPENGAGAEDTDLLHERPATMASSTVKDDSGNADIAMAT
jgi:hypothetical protein